jgi:hypothetical protein
MSKSVKSFWLVVIDTVSEQFRTYTTAPASRQKTKNKEVNIKYIFVADLSIIGS